MPADESRTGGIDPQSYEWAKKATQAGFAYSAAADRDAQLGRWCDTGFGPPDLCALRRKPDEQAQTVAPVAPVAPVTPVRAMVPGAPDGRTTEPASREVKVWGDIATAVVVFADGSEQKVGVRDELADGFGVVVAISVHGGVKVKRPGPDGKTVTLRRNRTAPVPVAMPPVGGVPMPGMTVQTPPVGAPPLLDRPPVGR